MSRPPKIEALRKQIATLQAEHLELTNQKRSRKEVAMMLDAMVNQWAATGMQGIARDLMRAANGEPSEPLTLRAAAPVAAAPGVAQISLNLGPMLVALVGAESVKTAFISALGTLPEGMDRTPRLARLSAIADELDTLELEEEGLIVASAGAIERRADARPEIILAGAA